MLEVCGSQHLFALFLPLAPSREGGLLTDLPIALLSTGEGKKKKKKKKPKKKTKLTQGDPPRTGLSKFFPDGNYPVGEEQEYKDEYVSPPKFLYRKFLSYRNG